MSEPRDWDLIGVHSTEPAFGANIGPTVLMTHPPEKCGGRACCVHNPSDHHMVTWPQLWRGDRGLMERTCPHGVGHPDPDHIAFVRLSHGEWRAYYEAVHGCDGCCQSPSPTEGTPT